MLAAAAAGDNMIRAQVGGRMRWNLEAGADGSVLCDPCGDSVGAPLPFCP